MSIINNYITEFYGDSELLFNMACIYPGDVTGDISADAELYRLAAEHLEKIDWDAIRAELIHNKLEVTITYGETK